MQAYTYRFTLSQAFGECANPNAIRDGDTWIVIRSEDRIPIEGHTTKESALKGCHWRNGRGLGSFIAEPLLRTKD
jgi:hypothetical protein